MKEQYFRKEIEEVLKKYPVGDMIQIERMPTGKMNDNFSIETTTGKFLIKRHHLNIGMMKKDWLMRQQKTLSILSRNGVKVIPGIKTTRRATVVEKNNARYVIYPFVENYPPKEITLAQIKDAAENLAMFHKQTKRIKINITYRRLRPWPRLDGFISSFYNGRKRAGEKSPLKLLAKKKNKDSYDQYIEENIPFFNALKKIIIMAQKRIKYPDMTLIHYDYQPANLLYDKEGKIIAIIDFDQVHKNLMQIDLIKAVRFFAMDKTQTKIDFKIAKTFIQSYLQSNPIQLRGEDIIDFLIVQVTRRLYYMLEIYYNHGGEIVKDLSRKDLETAKFILKNREKLKNLV